MELGKTYSPAEVETKWYNQWIENKLFESKPDGRQSYTMVIPPPNVTGVLHMGHLLNNSVQDIFIRRARMQGFNAVWVPGTDHASIATEAKVVNYLKEQGIDKKKLTREEFLKYAWEWKEKYGGIILKQLRKMGCSCDWNRTAFTMDPNYYKAVIHVFIELYEKGNIYRGVKMINWDPKAKTALSDEEVIHKEVRSKLYYVKYKLEGSDECITVATTRPETILGDTAVCVHPNDPRYAHLKGKFCFVPLINRRVPIIYDDYIDIEFGTGALKVTPAHDLNDYNLGLKHKLEVVDVLNDDGTMSTASQIYIGEDRFAVRKKIAIELEEKGLLSKIEEITNTNGFSERTDAVIEPRLSMQWWCNMTDMAKPALEKVMSDEIKFHPAKFKNTYRHWMENIKDWCISRQLMWGHRIPAWYDSKGNFVVAENETEARKKFIEKFPDLVEQKSNFPLTQDEDVLDTWFSSWLWPFEVFNWNAEPDNAELNYYYPTKTLVTAPEIIFFWVARMIMAGLEFKKEIPFTDVYFTGIVRDKQGRKMSKSLGNSPDLLDLIDQYGADACRFGILICSPAGNDLLYDEKLVEQGRNFNNKIWNALRLIKGWEIVDEKTAVNDYAINWFENKLIQTTEEIENHFKDFNPTGALKTLYNLIWDDFCAWYLEMIKPEFGKPIDRYTYEKTIFFFEELMKLLHPILPFVTEEIYQNLKDRKSDGSICIASFPSIKKFDSEIIEQGDRVKEIVAHIRNQRNQNNISPKEALELFVMGTSANGFTDSSKLIIKLANLKSFESTTTEIESSVSFLVKQDRFFLLLNKKIDVAQEKIRLEKDLHHQQGFLNSVMVKLSNEKFVANAKAEVLEKENQKKADAESKINSLNEQLSKLN
ncbi:valine--tRNA ligase [Bacteroidota bacterium]|nr:valine--tRNA ligase [Bacteroidota bacterium]